jgi:hypothetical protein
MAKGDGDPDLNRVVDAGFVFHAAQQRHFVPCEIVAFDLDSQTCSVQSTIEYKALNPVTGAVEFIGTIKANGIPIGFYGTGSWSLTGPIHVGDQGVCHVSDRCLSTWKSSTQTPVQDRTSRMWDFNDAVFMPLHCRPSFPLPTNNSGDLRPAVDAANNEQVCLRVAEDQGISLGSLSVNGLVALADKVATALDYIKGIFNTHVHTAPVIGATGITTSLIGSIPDTASDRVGSE